MAKELKIGALGCPDGWPAVMLDTEAAGCWRLEAAVCKVTDVSRAQQLLLMGSLDMFVGELGTQGAEGV